MTIQDAAAQGSSRERTTPALDGEDLSEIRETLQRSATGLSSELRRGGQRLMQDAGNSATSLANEKKIVAADYLRAVGEAAAASCDVLEQRGYAGSSRFLTQAVDGLAEFTDGLATREPAQLLDDAVVYARRNPALFLGAALFAGFGLARLVQASTGAEAGATEEDDEEMDEDEFDVEDESDDDVDASGEEDVDAV